MKNKEEGTVFQKKPMHSRKGKLKTPKAVKRVWKLKFCTNLFSPPLNTEKDFISFFCPNEIRYLIPIRLPFLGTSNP